MTLEEYTNEVKKRLRKYLKAEPQKELEKYILTLEHKGYIKTSYELDTNEKIAAITGAEAKPNPSGFCYAISLLYPDFPPSYK